MAELYDTLAGLVLGGLSVYAFFWNQGRAKKADEEKVANLINTENEKQDKQAQKNNDEWHRRLSQVIEELKAVQFELGYSKGYRNGHKDGVQETRADVALFEKLASAVKNS